MVSALGKFAPRALRDSGGTASAADWYRPDYPVHGIDCAVSRSSFSSSDALAYTFRVANFLHAGRRRCWHRRGRNLA
jgi:hypothetical protein